MRIWTFVLAAVSILAIDSILSACFIHSPLPVELIEDHITIEVNSQVATKTYTCTFYNPNKNSVEGGTCYMEVEPGAQIDKMTLEIDGRKMEGEILDADTARAAFKEILARGGSPALLEFYGKGLVRAQVPRIPPLGKVTAVLRYTTYLKSDDGLFRMRILNTNPKAMLKPLKRVTVNATIKSADPIQAVYSPTHNIEVIRTDDRNVTIKMEEENYLPKTPLAIYWQVAKGDLGISSMAYRDDEERGYFMLMISPGFEADGDILPKDIVFCVDTSGSMRKDNRFIQMQKALEECIAKLNPDDRFNIVSFGTTVIPFSNQLHAADPGTRRKAGEFLRKLSARGTTSMEDAMKVALSQFESTSRPRYVVFLTDGTPEMDESAMDSFCKRIQKQNLTNARIVTVGVGNSVNTKLLDRIAEENGGHTEYVMPRENVGDRLAAAYEKISNPVLTNLELDFGNLPVEEVYPRKLTDLYKGGQVVLFGRYVVSGDFSRGTVVLSGQLGEKSKKFEYSLSLPRYAEESDFLPRIWGGRKVANLVHQVKHNGSSDHKLDEIATIAKQYGIVTPYTSYLVSDDVISHGTPASPGFARAKIRKNIELYEKKDWRGRESLAAGETFQRFRSSALSLPVLYKAATLSTGRTEKQVMQKVRSIGPKTFYISDGSWYDGVYDPELYPDVIEVKQGSDELTKLIDELPGLARYFSLTRVVVLYRGKVYRVA